MEACITKKEQIFLLVNEITDNIVPMTKTTRSGFSYKKITTSSTGQFLNMIMIREDVTK